jgi:hypothetical protein
MSCNLFFERTKKTFASYTYNPTSSADVASMDAVHKRVYAIDPDFLLCTEELEEKQVHAIDPDILL